MTDEPKEEPTPDTGPAADSRGEAIKAGSVSEPGAAESRAHSGAVSAAGEAPSGRAAPAEAGAPQAPPAAAPTDPGKGDLDKVRARWGLGLAIVGWLMTVIGPAISFNAKLALSSDAGTTFQAFFLIVTTVLFLLAWRSLSRLPLWTLGLVGAVSLVSFLAYSQAKDKWTCVTYMDPAPLVMGTQYKPGPKTFLAKLESPPPTCEALMENWGGDAYQIWEEDGVRMRFLALFGLFALAWLSLALLVLGTVRRSLASWRPAK